jgi:uncharacterized protein YrzB (UPF0473 family)
MKNEEKVTGCSPAGCAGCTSCGDDHSQEENMSAEFSPIITLTDEEGNDLKFEILDVVVFEEKEYLVVAEAEVEDEEDVGVTILHITEEDGEEVYDTVVDEELAKKVFDEFVKQQEELEAEESEDEE